ncbi:protein tyrosine phosphatase receptor type C-associated protein [Microcaecilia unicolor]|uniref:Protein tyrosine phosphatase receptor type C-associated protein n=1 Tax=Microcaecilia unicolor TaxID=1415580 RepID=A0A6P7WSM2_9AMPH|nr:protein tyrosine phosphatase receptor type C-associated protein [Microcaecilia unicolor]
MALASSGWTWVCLSLVFKLGVQASEDKVPLWDSTTTVVVLSLLFLLLLAAFIMAWYHLNRVTEGRYHPRNLCRGEDGEEQRAGPVHRLVHAVAGTWWTFHSWVRREAAEEDEDAEKTELQQRDKEEVQDGEDGFCKRSKGRCSQQDMDDGDEESSSNEPNSEDDYSSFSGRDLRDGARAQEPEVTEEEPKAGSSEALLCDLHAFSGSAVWQDESVQGSGRLDVTAL